MGNERVRVTDVSLRDGLQNEPGFVATGQKLELAKALWQAGLDEIEVTSFVSPRWIPQLADAGELVERLRDAVKGTAGPVLSVLVPNEKGMDRAEALIDAGCPIGKVSVFTAASETFSNKNTNASIAETVERFKPVVERAKARGLAVRGYVSCVIACPFEGAVRPEAVEEVAGMLDGLGIEEIDLGDTIGAGDAASVSTLIGCVERRVGIDRLTMHLHDTRGKAAECVRASLDCGVRSFDGAVGGIGGCPYAATAQGRAPGNIATEVLVGTVESAGFATGVNRTALAHAGRIASDVLRKAREGRDG